MSLIGYVADGETVHTTNRIDLVNGTTSATASLDTEGAIEIVVYFGSPTVYPYLRPMTRYLCAGVGVVVRILINILAGRECACVCV